MIYAWFEFRETVENNTSKNLQYVDIMNEDTLEPRSQNVSICSQHENCRISLKIVSTRSQNSF